MKWVGHSQCLTYKPLSDHRQLPLSGCTQLTLFNEVYNFWNDPSIDWRLMYMLVLIFERDKWLFCICRSNKDSYGARTRIPLPRIQKSLLFPVRVVSGLMT